MRAVVRSGGRVCICTYVRACVFVGEHTRQSVSTVVAEPRQHVQEKQTTTTSCVGREWRRRSGERRCLAIPCAHTHLTSMSIRRRAGVAHMCACLQPVAWNRRFRITWLLGWDMNIMGRTRRRRCVAPHRECVCVCMCELVVTHLHI